MTWTLLDVEGRAALVGADGQTNAYMGDASVDEVLPILCVKKRSLSAPEGLKAHEFYNAWSGCELRLSKPVAGKDLASLDAANAIVKEQLGEGWEMAEFHATGGGWHLWGYWTEPPKPEK